MKLRPALLLPLLSVALCVRGQESIVVTGTWQPLPLEEADRSIRSIPLRDLRLVTNTFADLLRLDSSVDLRQRAPNGLQGDVSIRGGSFGQTLVLLDGMRLNDAQSAHHNLDLPVPLDGIESVEILKGSGSTLYGADAVGGVVNFVSAAPEANAWKLRAALGNFGVNQQSGSGAFAGRLLRQRFTFARDFSTGFMPNRDYRNLSLASDSRLQSRVGETHILLAHRDSPFGAEQFYGNYNSWERTRSWWAAARQQIGSRTEAAFVFRRHTDLFVLYRDRPQVYTNRHAVESIQANVRRRDPLARNTTVFYGAEVFHDSIGSNNLGRHNRMRSAVYSAVDFRALRRFSLNAGLRDEIWGSANHQLSPSLSGGFWLTPSLKARASVSRAFRLPTYTDLYYQDPANRGSASLRPEKAWGYEGGLEWTRGRTLQAGVTVFQRRETDGIDYVRSGSADIWRATNFQRLQFTGVEADLRTTLPGDAGRLELSWTGLRGAQDLLTGLQSKYVFNYPVHSGLVSWQTSIANTVAMRSRVGVVERFARDRYAVWDLYAASSRGRVRPFFQMTNLSGTDYQEIPGVRMPGRGILGGLEWMLTWR